MDTSLLTTFDLSCNSALFQTLGPTCSLRSANSIRIAMNKYTYSYYTSEKHATTEHRKCVCDTNERIDKEADLSQYRCKVH